MEKEGRWNGIPDIALMKTFGESKTVARARMRLVCKSWKQILTRDDLPAGAHPKERPWEFQPEHSVFDSESNLLSEIQFQRFGDNGRREQTHRFKLPNFQGDDDIGGGVGWLCGCSDGWLIIAAGPRLNPDMFLWNPLINKIRKLPPLMSTLGSFKSFDVSKRYNISDYVKRVKVFSDECIVAMVFTDPLGGEERQEFMAFSTPKDECWVVFEGDSRYRFFFHDILVHKGNLYALVEQSLEDEESHLYKVSLSNCEVQVCVLPFCSKKALSGEHRKFYDEEKLEHPLFNIHYNDHVSLRLGEFFGQLLLVKAVYDRCVVNKASECPVKALQCLRISNFTLEMFDGMKTVLLESLGGNSNVILADNGFFTVSKGVDGDDKADSVIYRITSDHAGGFIEDRGDCVVRENGTFNLPTGVIERKKAVYLSYPTRFTTCFLAPKLN